MSHEKLRQAIIAANPSLGTIEKKYKSQECSECYGYGYLVDVTGEEVSDCFTCGGTCRERVEYLLERLNQDIQLHHVLIAMDVKSNSVKGLRFPEEHTVETPALWIIGKCINLWNLSKPFSEQSDQCLSFLTELLCG